MIGENFLRQKRQSIKLKMENLDLYKFQKICPSKDMVKKMGR